MTLTGIGLAAVAAGAVGQLIPAVSVVAPGAHPFLVYAAAIFLPSAGIWALTTMGLGSGLQKALLGRLGFNSNHSDAVSLELQSLFIEDIRKDLQALKSASTGLLRGVFALVGHTYFIIIMNLGFLDPDDFRFIQPFLPDGVLKAFAISGLSAQTVEYYALSLGLVVVEAVREFRNDGREWKDRVVLKIDKYY